MTCVLSARSYVVLALPCMGHLPNCVGGGFLINCAAVYQWAARRRTWLKKFGVNSVKCRAS